MINYNCQLLIGDPPNPAGFVDDAIEVDYFINALETRLKYCPNEIVGITISAESARRILKVLKEAQKIPDKMVNANENRTD